MPSGSDNEDNKKWGFGQVMPVVLLAAPLVPVVEATIRTYLYRGQAQLILPTACMNIPNLPCRW
jgi:hypothetical protein